MIWQKTNNFIKDQFLVKVFAALLDKLIKSILYYV